MDTCNFEPVNIEELKNPGYKSNTPFYRNSMKVSLKEWEQRDKTLRSALDTKKLKQERL
jgi:hypothetical protein